MRTGWPVALCALIAVAVGGLAQEDRAARKQLEAEYAKLVAALKDKDLKALEGMLAPDATLKPPEGQPLDRRQLLAAWKDWFGRVRSVKAFSYRIDRLTVEGDRAVASVTATVSFTATDNTGRVLKFEGDETSTDTWRKTATGWKLQQIAAGKGLTGTPVEGGPP